MYGHVHFLQATKQISPAYTKNYMLQCPERTTWALQGRMLFCLGTVTSLLDIPRQHVRIVQADKVPQYLAKFIHVGCLGNTCTSTFVGTYILYNVWTCKFFASCQATTRYFPCIHIKLYVCCSAQREQHEPCKGERCPVWALQDIPRQTTCQDCTGW